jgi:hypothetical protein
MYSPKKTTSGLSIPWHTLQSGTTKPSLEEEDVAVGAELDGIRHRDPGVVRLDARRQVAAIEHLPAVRAEHAAHRAVQFDDTAAARAHVQAVHVLGDDPARDTAALQLGEGEMAVVRLRGGESAPSQVAADPVPSARGRTGEELLRRHRGARGSALAAVVGNAGVRRHTRAGEHRDAPTREGIHSALDGIRGLRIEVRYGLVRVIQQRRHGVLLHRSHLETTRPAFRGGYAVARRARGVTAWTDACRAHRRSDR